MTHKRFFPQFGVNKQTFAVPGCLTQNESYALKREGFAADKSWKKIFWRFNQVWENKVLSWSK